VSETHNSSFKEMIYSVVHTRGHGLGEDLLHLHTVVVSVALD
jgi:hypothetical protein